MSGENEFRILGPELDEKDSYVDVIVSGIDSDGDIYVADKYSSREWELSSERIQSLQADNWMIPKSAVKTSGLWNVADDVAGKRPNVTTPFADSALAAVQRRLFEAAYAETNTDTG